MAHSETDGDRFCLCVCVQKRNCFERICVHLHQWRMPEKPECLKCYARIFTSHIVTLMPLLTPVNYSRSESCAWHHVLVHQRGFLMSV